MFIFQFVSLLYSGLLFFTSNSIRFVFPSNGKAGEMFSSENKQFYCIFDFELSFHGTSRIADSRIAIGYDRYFRNFQFLGFFTIECFHKPFLEPIRLSMTFRHLILLGVLGNEANRMPECNSMLTVQFPSS